MVRRSSSRKRPGGQLASELPELFAVALARCDLRARTCTHIARFQLGAERRALYRLELDDGRLVKARCCTDEARAQEVREIRRHLPQDGLARVYAQHGPVLIEEWIEGTPLPPADGTAAHVIEAATILAGLHAVERIGAAAARSTTTTAERLEQAQRDLAAIVEHQALPASRVDTLQSTLRRFDPGAANTGVIHRDFCAENMVRERGGRVRVIDNEWLTLGPLGYDLGRVWCRWPMPRAAWMLFLETYAGQGGQALPDAPLTFWKIAATARSAALRLADPIRLREPVERLLELSETLEAAG